MPRFAVPDVPTEERGEYSRVTAVPRPLADVPHDDLFFKLDASSLSLQLLPHETITPWTAERLSASSLECVQYIQPFIPANCLQGKSYIIDRSENIFVSRDYRGINSSSLTDRPPRTYNYLGRRLSSADESLVADDTVGPNVI